MAAAWGHFWWLGLTRMPGWSAHWDLTGGRNKKAGGRAHGAWGLKLSFKSDRITIRPFRAFRRALGLNDPRRRSRKGCPVRHQRKGRSRGLVFELSLSDW